MRQQPVRFGKYLLLKRLSIGGMAEVVFAKTSGFDRLLAIKRILPELEEDEEFLQMFVDEARLSLLLNHPNIVQVFDFGQCEGTYYLATEYVAGKDLRAILQRCTRRDLCVPLPMAAYIAANVCAGLGYAHSRRDTDGTELNIVHRDVSPPNVVCSWTGEIKLIDFGIAKSAARTQTTRVGMLKGKLAYMSSEQAQGQPVDQRSDVFAIGAVLYEMVTGKQLFEGQGEAELLKNVCLGRFVRPSKLNPAVSAELEAVLHKALARVPAERYPTATAMSDALVQAVPEALEQETRTRLVTFVQEIFAVEYERDQARLRAFGEIDAAWEPDDGDPPTPLPDHATPARVGADDRKGDGRLAFGGTPLPEGPSGLPEMDAGFLDSGAPPLDPELLNDSSPTLPAIDLSLVDLSSAPAPAARGEGLPPPPRAGATPAPTNRSNAAPVEQKPGPVAATAASPLAITLQAGPQLEAAPRLEAPPPRAPVLRQAEANPRIAAPVDPKPGPAAATAAVQSVLSREAGPQLEAGLQHEARPPPLAAGRDLKVEDLGSGFKPGAPVFVPRSDPPLEEDRRVHARVPAAIAVLRRHGSTFIEERTRDLSVGGIGLGTRSLLMPGTEAEFTLTAPDGSFEVPFAGQVANARSVDDEFPFLAGVRIVRMDPGIVPLYESLILKQLEVPNGMRAQLRLPVRFACIAFWKEAGAKPASTTRVIDISQGGVRCTSANVPSKGSHGLLTLASPIDDRLVSLPAEVVWASHGGSEDQAGIRFSSDQLSRELITQLIREVIISPQRALNPNAAGDQSVRVGEFDCRTLVALGQHFEIFSGFDRKVQWAGKRVALKRLRPGAGPRVLESFLEEADVLRMLDHPGSARALAALQFGGESWLVTELSGGRSLAQIIANHGRERRHLPVQAVLSIMSELVRVLIHRRAFTRAQGHGNGPVCVKPSGLMISAEGKVKVVDFGALDVVHSEELGTAGLAAILPYRPPEGWPGNNTEFGPGEVYTVSVLLYEALTGVCPFRGASVEEMRAASRRGPVAIRRINPEVAAALETLVLAGLSAEPRMRPPRLTSFLAELDKAAAFPRAEEGRRMRAALLNVRPLAS